MLTLVPGRARAGRHALLARVGLRLARSPNA